MTNRSFQSLASGNLHMSLWCIFIQLQSASTVMKFAYYSRKGTWPMWNMVLLSHYFLLSYMKSNLAWNYWNGFYFRMRKQTVLSWNGKVMNCPSVIGYQCIKSNWLFIILCLITTVDILAHWQDTAKEHAQSWIVFCQSLYFLAWLLVICRHCSWARGWS